MLLFVLFEVFDFELSEAGSNRSAALEPSEELGPAESFWEAIAKADKEIQEPDGASSRSGLARSEEEPNVSACSRPEEHREGVQSKVQVFHFKGQRKGLEAELASEHRVRDG